MTHSPTACYSVVFIRTNQILATGLTLKQARRESRDWNRQATVDDCSTWQPAPEGIVFRGFDAGPYQDEEKDCC